MTEQKKLLANQDSTSSVSGGRKRKTQRNAVPRRVSGGRKRAPEKGLS
jgi:hypothetical protein